MYVQRDVFCYYDDTSCARRRLQMLDVRSVPSFQVRSASRTRRAKPYRCWYGGGGAFGGGTAKLGGGVFGGGIAAFGGGAFGGGIAAFGGGALT